MNITSRYILLILVLFTAIKGIGQKDTLVTKSYEELRDLLNQKKDTAMAIAASRAYYSKGKKDNRLKDELLGLEAISSNLNEFGQKEYAMSYLDSALNLSRKLEDKTLLIRLLRRKADLLFINTAYSQAVDTYYLALNEAERTDDFLTQQSILNNISLIKNNLEDYEGSRKILQEALVRSKKQDYKPDSDEQKQKDGIEMALNANIAKAFINASNPDSAMVYTRRSFEKSKLSEKDSCNIRILHYLNTESYLLKNDFVKAKKALDSARLKCESTSSKLQVSGYLGQIYLGEKKYRDAVDVLSQGIKDEAPETLKMQFVIEYYKYLAKAHKGLGKIDSANYYLEKYITSSTNQDEVRSNVAGSFKRREVAIFQKELNELTEQKTQGENLLRYGGIAGGALILLLVFGLIRSNKKRKENEQKFEELLEKMAAAKSPEEIIDTKDEVLDEQSTSDVNPETTQQILDGLKKLEEQNYFLHPACSAHNVAKRIKTNTTYLSKVINAEFGKNFSTYVNDLRINYAIVRLKQDSKFRSYTISSIATELGYKSADSFTKYFKKDTGLLPSFYIKKLNEVA